MPRPLPAYKLKEQASDALLTDDGLLHPRIMHMTVCVGSSVMGTHLPDINQEEWIQELKSGPSGLKVHDIQGNRFVFPSTEVQGLRTIGCGRETY